MRTPVGDEDSGDAGDVDEVRRNQKCINCGTLGLVARGCRWKGKKGRWKGARQGLRQGTPGRRQERSRERENAPDHGA